MQRQRGHPRPCRRGCRATSDQAAGASVTWNRHPGNRRIGASPAPRQCCPVGQRGLPVRRGTTRVLPASGARPGARDDAVFGAALFGPWAVGSLCLFSPPCCAYLIFPSLWLKELKGLHKYIYMRHVAANFWLQNLPSFGVEHQALDFALTIQHIFSIEILRSI